MASIIVPVFNRKHLITPCIHSLLQQKMPDYEIIIIDDSSTDGTEDVLRAIPQDDRLSIIRTHKNCGPAYARNRGIERSKGQFIALIDSDCIAHPNWLAEIIRPFHEDLT
ncbi:MAG: glycosyltransferase family 2 protein, partial [Candidatus Omnitrophica bacterium]|nr:glycosyltransferase family 2 protein [Candidatus Omnitrophota bacterium]